MSESQPATEATDPTSAGPDQPHHMTHTDSQARPTTPEVPPAPGADVDSDELQAGADRQAGAPAQQDENDRSTRTPQPAEQVSSPELDHLDETIDKARHAADEALAPQRE